MPGITLLNIEREKSKKIESIDEIRGIISDISKFTRNISPDSPSIRFVPLKMKLKQLQDAVSQFGSDGSIPINTKQSAIMELHPELMFLSNEVGEYGIKYLTMSDICMNFLLTHLCSTAAVDPRSTVIGVSNVMAQVLSSGMQIIEYPEFNLSPTDNRYFDEFSIIFNSMLTTAGLFAAPVLGLPDIPMSALGGWADQALEQFSTINQFIHNNFDPAVFYKIDQKMKSKSFDTTTDILSFYVFENEFLAALIARADLLSGLEFKITEDNVPVTLQSTEEITKLLASTIKSNCREIERHLAKIDEMFITGQIDRNEKPSDHPNLMNYKIESKIWRKIADFAIYLVKIFENENTEEFEEARNIKLHVSKEDQYPPLDSIENELQKELFQILITLETNLFTMFPTSRTDTENFIRSSDFTKFRDFLQYIITIVAANDILLRSEYSWLPWLLNRHGKFFLGASVKHNPHGAMQNGILSVTLGLISDTRIIIEEGLGILNDVKPHLEFQMHHLLAIEIINKLVGNPHVPFKNTVDSINTTIMEFLQSYEINPNSMLFQRSNLYLAMLSMYKESDQDEYLRKKGERFVAFDPYSWIQVPPNFKPSFPYMPLNTSIDNLNSG